jgi:uncharacterized protein (TIGR02001 family)
MPHADARALGWVMKKIIGAALAAGAAVSAAGAAEAQSISASVTMTSDYVFRGMSLSGEDAAVQGSFDYATDLFYAGAWASSLGSAGTSMELDVYAGFTPTIGPVALDLGVVGYFYPGADDNGAEFDFFELVGGGTINIRDNLTLGAALAYTPENYGETGEAIYSELNGAYSITDAFAASAAFGSYRIDDVNGPIAGAPSDTYNSWNVGATYALHGFELDLRYHDADISSSDALIAWGFGTEAIMERRFVFSISRAL